MTKKQAAIVIKEAEKHTEILKKINVTVQNQQWTESSFVSTESNKKKESMVKMRR